MAIPTKFQQGVFYILDSNNNLVTSIEVNTYEDYRRIMSIRALQTEDELKFKFDTSGNTSAALVQNDINSTISFSGIPATPAALGALPDAPAFGPKTLSEDFPSESKSVANTQTSVTLVRDSFISSLRFGFSNGAGNLQTISGDFEDGDILFVMPNSNTNAVTINESGNISLVSSSNFTLRGGSDANDAGRFIALRYISSSTSWVELFRSRVISEELPQQTPASGQKFYLSKDSAGTLAFSSIENASTQNLILKFTGQITSASSIVLGSVPANCIVLADRIMAKLDTGTANTATVVSLAIGGNSLENNSAWNNTFIYGANGADGEVTLNDNATFNSPTYFASSANVTFTINSGTFTSGRNNFSIIIPYIEL